MALNTKASIIPVGISGAFACKPKNRWWLAPGAIIINIGDPINCREFKNLAVDELLRRVELKIKYLSGENHEDK